MKTINVNPADYYPHLVDNPYPEYFDKTNGNCPFRQGDVVFDENNQTVGIVLGKISEKNGTLLLDSDGIQPYENMRPATLEDVKKCLEKNSKDRIAIGLLSNSINK